MTDIAPFLIAPSQLALLEEPWSGPLAIVDLDRAGDLPEACQLPPCPVIGIGDPAHPLAAWLDAVVEPPIGLAAIVRHVTATPLAAATIVQLLRLLPLLPPQQGLVAESQAYALLQGSAEHARWMSTLSVQETSVGETVAEDDPRIDMERAGATLTITLTHAAAGNAIDRPMRDALTMAFALAVADSEVARVVLRARGRTFSLGAVLGEFGTTRDPAAAHDIRARTLPARFAARCAEKLEVRVQGGCVGSGLELAAWGQRIVARADAWFHLPELAMGILPGAGGCVSLTRRIGRQRTALLILSGRRLNARQALDWGLVDEVVERLPGDESGADAG